MTQIKKKMETTTFEAKIYNIVKNYVYMEVLIDEKNGIFEEREFPRNAHTYFNKWNVKEGDYLYLHITTGSDFMLWQFEKHDGEFESFKRIREKLSKSMEKTLKSLEKKGFFGDNSKF